METFRNKINNEQRAFNYVINLILTHQLKPGDKIYEPDITDSLKVSRTPVRHALAKLVSEGMLEKKTRERGYIVPILTPEDMEQVFIARETLEGKSAYLAAIYATDEDINLLKELNKREKAYFQEGNKKKYAEINEKIHLLVAKASKNVYLERYVTQSYWRSQLYTFYLASFYSNGNDIGENEKHLSYVEHARLISAIERRSAEEARELIVEHIKSTYRGRFK